MTEHDDDPLGQLQFDAFGRLVDLDEMELERYPAPPRVRWVPVDDLAHVQGLRVATEQPARASVRTCSAATDVLTDDEGRWVNVVEEWRWYAWHEMPAERAAYQWFPCCPLAQQHGLG